MDKQLIPKLRFPEFKGNWSKTVIKDIATKITDGTHDTPKPITKGIPFLTAIHVKDGFIDYENCYYLPLETHKKIYDRCNPEKGDLLMVNIGAGTATSALVKVEYEFSLKNVALIKPNYELVNSNFFEQVQRKNSERLKHQISSGGAQPFLSLKEIGKLKLNIPEIEEQQKIASFLISVDERITLLTQQKEKIELYKKGIMQQLFAQELRFKDSKGKSFPDWKGKSLGQIGITLNGLTGKTKEHFGKGKPYIQYMQIFRASRIFTDEFGLVQINDGEAQSKVQYGDVFFTTSSETPNEIGTSSVLLDKVDEVYLNSFCFGYRPNSLDELVPEFAQFLFRSKNVRDEIVKLAQGSTRFNMSKVAFMKQRIMLPCKEEQQKIADFLIAIDNQIEQVHNQKGLTIDFKKGLLQQMFV